MVLPRKSFYYSILDVSSRELPTSSMGPSLDKFKKPEKRRSVLLCQSFAYCGQNVVSEDETLSSDIHRTCEFLFSTKLDTKIGMLVKHPCIYDLLAPTGLRPFGARSGSKGTL